MTERRKSSSERRIGLFGGTFDPFTPAHMSIVDTVLEKDLVDSVTIIPTIVDYHRTGKDRWLTDDEKFRVMHGFVRRSQFQDRIFMDFQEIEWRRSGKLSDEEARSWRFIDTLGRIDDLYRGSTVKSFRLFAIIGTDSLRNFRTWSRWEEILEKCTLIAVTGRDGENVETDIPHIPVEIQGKFMDMSSSKMRERFSTADEYMRYVLGEFR